MDWLLILPEGLEVQFQERMTQYEEAKRMPYVTSFERIGMKRGQLKEARQSLIDNLETRFGVVPISTVERINQLENVEVLRQLRRRAIMIETLEAFEQLLDQALAEGNPG